MELLPNDVLEKIPGIGEQDGMGDSTIIWVKYFTPDSCWTWFVTEYSKADGIFFGFVVGHESEWGYFSLNELKSIKGPLGLPIERDIQFKPCALREILNN